MSVADDLRKQTHQTIETGRRTPEPSPVQTAAPRQGAAPQQPRQQTQTSATVNQVNPVNSATVNGNTADQATEVSEQPDDEITEVDEMTRMLTPEQQAAAEERRRKEAAKRKKLYGEIDDKFKDPDEGDYEKGKFDIQQGDFIEFLMKDVVLESAKWAGDKVCGLTGLYTYRVLSWTYHNIKDPISEEYNLMLDDLAKKRAETKKQVEKSKADDFAPSANDDKTTKFAKEVYALHKKQLDHNPYAEDTEAVTAAIHAAIDGRLDDIKLNDKTGQPLPANHKLMQYLHRLSENARGWQDKEAAKTNVAHLLTEQITNYNRIQTAAGNYAVAKMIQEKSKDPNKFDGQNMETNYKEYFNQGYKTVLLESRYILRGTSEYEDLNGLLQTSVSALDEAKDNIKKHNYMDENGQGHLPQTPQLQKLDNILDSASASARSQTIDQLTEQTLPDFAALCNRSDAELNRRYQQAANDSDAADAVADEYAHRREQQRGAQSKPRPNNSRTVGPAFTQGGSSR